MWKVPARGEDVRLGLYVRLPDGCENVTEPRAAFAGGAYFERWRVRHSDALAGGTIRVTGLQATLTDVLVRIERLDGATQVTRLAPSSPSMVVTASPGRWRLGWTYFALGVEHILLGIDHPLFVLALMLLVRGTRRLVWTTTAFTVAHSITLALATLGVVHVPGPPVEAIIALSIVFVAAEILRARGGRTSTTERHPWIVAFTFGLLHGLGFAGALSEVGLPQHAIPTSLLFFTVGAEVGQLVFVAAAAVAGAVTVRWRDRAGWAAAIPPYAIGGVAMFWVIDRVVDFA